MKLLLTYILFLFLIAGYPTHTKAQSSADEKISLEDGFSNPPVTARPKALWPWVNGNFSLSAITYELEEAKQKGMGGFDIWDVGTMVNPGNIVPDGPAFLGDESLDAIAHAIREANRLDLELGLITSSSWNAGGTWVKPEHGAMGLFRSDTVVTGPVTFRGSLPFPDIPDQYGNHKTIVSRDKNGLPVFYKEVALIAHPVRKDSVVKLSEIMVMETPIENTAITTFDVPAGKWRIVRYVCAPTGQPLMVPSPESNGLMLDHFSAEAQEANMNYIIGRLKTKFKTLANTSLKYLYEDSYEVNTAIWTPQLPNFFEERNGYSVQKYLPALDGFVINNADFTDRFTFDYNKVLSDLIIQNHYAKGREICEREGIGFYAEAGGPGKPIHNVPFEDLKALGSLTVPRGEFWNKHPSLELLQIVKGISSAAHIYNQKAVEAESFTSVWLWQEGPDELKPLADRAMCEGLNRFVYHTFPHTTPEAGAPGWIYNFGTLINTTNGWWPKSDGFHNYLARCSYLLQQGNFKGDVAFYYGDEAPNFVKPKHIPATLGKGYDYDVVNTDVILNRMTVKDGKIVLPHGQYYEVLVLPEDERINPKVLQRVEQMIKEGATVVGKRPTKSYSLSDAEASDKMVKSLAGKVWGKNGKEKTYGKGKIVWNKTVRQVLMEKGVSPDVQFVSSTGHDSLDFIHRYTNDTDIYFIRNISKDSFSGAVTFRVKGKQPQWWNPVNGNISPISISQTDDKGITLPLLLNGEESAFIIFRGELKPHVAKSNDVNVFNTANGLISLSGDEIITIATPWAVRFQKKGNTPIEISSNQLESWHTSTNESIKHFSGTAAYTNHFSITKDQRTGTVILLELNKVREIADVFLNGEKLGTHWYHEQQFDISDKVTEGENTLTVEVVNSINNALIGDAQKPQEFRAYRSNISKLPNAWKTPFAEAPLLEAGLIGPVQIRLVKKIE